ncbi:MAG: hypothetical protein Q8P08_01925, partial [bacterium]|nr:hypothetical protein [bacterium]
TPDIIEETEAQKIFGPEKGRVVSELLKKTLVPDGIGRDPLTLRYKDGDVQKLADQGTEEAHLVKEAAFKKAVDAMKTSDLDIVDPSLGSSVAFQRAVTKWKNNTAFLQKSFEKWGPEFIEKIQIQAEKIDYTLKSVAKTNPSLIKMSYTPFGKTFMRPWTVKRTASDRGNILGKNRAQDLVLAAGREAPSWSPIKGLSEVKPVPSEQEKIKFANIAEGTKGPSPAIDQNALREVRGGINALAYRMRENQNEINKKLGEISRASAEEKELLGTRLSTFQGKKAKYESTDKILKDRADLIAERFSREVAEKVRKKRKS